MHNEYHRHRHRHHHHHHRRSIKWRKRTEPAD
jgi:hypothetical protein